MGVMCDTPKPRPLRSGCDSPCFLQDLQDIVNHEDIGSQSSFPLESPCNLDKTNAGTDIRLVVLNQGVFLPFIGIWKSLRTFWLSQLGSRSYWNIACKDQGCH